MSRRYEILADYGLKATEADNLSTSPYAIVAIWRHKYPVTFSRAIGGSFTDVVSAASELRDFPVVITDDLMSVQVSHGKSNHLGTAAFRLRATMNYFTEFFPGDYVLIWMMNDQVSYHTILQKIRDGEPCNDFLSGLKFFGKLNSIRKNINQDPGGMRTTSFSCNASSFTELDAGIYYEPHLSGNANSGLANSMLKYTGLAITELINGSAEDLGKGISPDTVIPLFLRIFYGSGVPKNMNIPDTEMKGKEMTKGLDTPDAFVIPNPIASIFLDVKGGEIKGSKPNGKFAYTDILELIHGVQKYDIDSPISNPPPSSSSNSVLAPSDAKNAESNKIANIFTPDKIKPLGPNSVSTSKFTETYLLGTFTATIPQFSGERSVWQILQGFLNPVVNEMYTTLRVNANNKIVPTMICRQQPFSSGLVAESFFVDQEEYKDLPSSGGSRGPRKPRKLYSEQPKAPKISSELSDEILFSSVKNHDEGRRQVGHHASKPAETKTVSVEHKLNLTKFATLPRWVVHPVLVKALDVGRSDAMRFNMIHVYGDSGTKANETFASPLLQFVKSPPVFDDLDILRNGIRSYSQVVPCSEADALNYKARDWMKIIADTLMGGHLRVSGTITMVGVQSPICPGDNLEFDGHIFHIETVSHSFQIAPNGTKTFTTQVQLTYGVRGAEEMYSDTNQYTGSDHNDLRQYEAKQSNEYAQPENAPSVPGTAETHYAEVLKKALLDEE